MARRRRTTSPGKSRAPPKEASKTEKPAKKAQSEKSSPKPTRKKPGKKPPGESQSPPTTSTNAAVPIVAIGASAGGLDALKRFFAHVPADSGIGFIVLTHTSPTRPTMLPELLSAVAAIPVVAGEPDTRVCANEALVATDSFLAIEDGVLRRVADSYAAVSHHPIDHFFRSLAADRREHAICVVLSGSGNDGTLGLEAIKAAGGMAMVQDPESAKYADMPESARATGLADYVLAPEELGGALVRYCRGPFLTKAAVADEDASELADDAIHAILIRLRNHHGQDFTAYKKSTMSRRIVRRMNVHRIDDPEVYLRFLRDNPAELDVLLQELLISVTSFFRDSPAWLALADQAIPEILASHEDGATLRIWVPGCATGEEAYSLAILVHEQLHAADRHLALQLFASDPDARAIDAARAGFYSRTIAADVSSDRLQRWFTEENGGYRIRKVIRDAIVFAVQNVISDPPFTRMDLIACRNLLIYLTVEAQQRVVPIFHYALRPGGVLFLGASETIGVGDSLFAAIDNKQKIFRRRDTHAPARAQVPTSRPRSPIAHTANDAGKRLLSRNIEHLLLDRFAPCSIVVDDQNNVLYLRGRGGDYLEPEQGAPRNNLLAMAREGLRPALHELLRQARREPSEPVRRAVRVHTSGDTAMVEVAVTPLLTASLRGLLLITLQPQSEAADARPAAPPVPAPPEQDLDRELQYTRESLQSTVEELEAANEELRSTNEELQSTNEELHSSNEELETSKEEMQSLNEELNTVNAELQSKVEALAHANDDMNNVLNSIHVATIFLDGDLRVKRFTDQARELVRLIESDIGRPLSDLTTSLQYDDLLADCGRVLATLEPSEREVRDQRGSWYLVRLIPYRSADNVIDGLVLTMLDINRIKHAEADSAATRVTRDFFRGIVQTVREAIVVLDHELRVLLANEAFHRTFRTRPEEIDGEFIDDLCDGRWSIPDLRVRLDQVMSQGEVVNDLRVEHDFPWIGRRVFWVNARRLPNPDGNPEMVLLAFEDATTAGERKLDDSV